MVSSSLGGRVSPTMAKLSVERVPPPGPTPEPLEPLELLELELLDVVDVLELELLELLDVVDVLELELLDVDPHPQGVAASPTHCESQVVLQQ